jgi:biopolymer transport protein ExbB
MFSFSQFFSEIEIVLVEGGPVLWVMFVLSVILYGLIVSTWTGLHKVKQEIHALDDTKVSYHDEKSIECDVAVFKLDRFAWVQRRLPMIAVLVASAPLSGLLGTVYGMFLTFDGLANQDAARPIDSISMGISSAMITTEAGLLMAIPGAILLAILQSQVSKVEGSLEQKMYHHMVTMKGQNA